MPYVRARVIGGAPHNRFATGMGLVGKNALTKARWENHVQEKRSLATRQHDHVAASTRVNGTSTEAVTARCARAAGTHQQTHDREDRPFNQPT